ncbi:MAG TPA: AMP-binding protein, partial [Rugosimonospora sp.]|nr:AMP-binding protein [Rugosimonospora sp.]
WAARARLLNLYGPAEATIWASYAELSPDTDTGLIGRPVAGLAAQVCDERGAPLPTGRAGELYLSGPTVALGYHGRPDLTAGRFSTAPDGSRRYRTGDVVVAAADGQLSFRGRVDRRLDVRGVRIEPEEIERVVCEYPGVDLARAFLAEAGVLTAVYSPDRPPPTGVAAHLRERLPRWLVPQRIIGAAVLPLGATGKVDERALRALGGNRVAEPDFAICAAVSGL